MKYFYIFIFLYFCIFPSVAQRADYRIIPQPKSVETDTTQVFTLQDGMTIAYDAANEEVARNAQFLLGVFGGCCCFLAFLCLLGCRLFEDEADGGLPLGG